MMKKLISALLIIFASSCYASYKQNVKVCLNAINLPQYTPLDAGFKSHDFWDSGNDLVVNPNGSEKCISHTYQHGPKSILVRTYLLPNPMVSYININLDPSCSYLQNYNGIFRSDFMRTGMRYEIWNFTYTFTDKDHATLSCYHEGY